MWAQRPERVQGLRPAIFLTVATSWQGNPPRSTPTGSMVFQSIAVMSPMGEASGPPPPDAYPDRVSGEGERRPGAGEHLPADPVGRPWWVPTPNLLSALRLVGVPVFFWLLLIEADLWAVLVLVVSGLSDYLDGKIARAYDLTSTAGGYLDAIADRLYIASTVLGFGLREIIPWWFVLILVARDAFAAGMYPLARLYRLPPPPVHFVGKAATFNLLYAFPILLLAEQGGAVQAVALPLGWAFIWWGTGLYWIAIMIYTAQVADMVRQRRRQWRAVCP
jgi:cardiolipin synthase